MSDGDRERDDRPGNGGDTDADRPVVCPVCGADFESVSVHDEGVMVNLLDNDRFQRVCFQPVSDDEGPRWSAFSITHTNRPEPGSPARRADEFPETAASGRLLTGHFVPRSSFRRPLTSLGLSLLHGSLRSPFRRGSSLRSNPRYCSAVPCGHRSAEGRFRWSRPSLFAGRCAPAHTFGDSSLRSESPYSCPETRTAS